MVVFAAENGEEWQPENLWIFPKQIGTPPTDLPVFRTAYFIPPKGNSSVKTISISANNDFSPLKTYIFNPRSLFVKILNNYVKTGYTPINTTNTIFTIFILPYTTFTDGKKNEEN